MNYQLSHLKALEAESIYILREVAAQFENAALLFSGGKDSIVVAWLARKAFYPTRIPFRFMHVDTGHNFPETLSFRDEFIKQMNGVLVVASVQEAVDAGKIREESGYDASRNTLQTAVLLQALKSGKFDAAIGGGRRDEEKARAKERIFSHRDVFGQWDPRNQRPELWHLYNGQKSPGEHFRIFPISNWTELDVWQYIAQENIDLPSLYFTHQRSVIDRDGILLADSPFLNKRPEEVPFEARVRCRTIGDMTCTGLWRSEAHSVKAIVEEIASSRTTERGGRADDRRSDTAMEDRKKLGYF